jgi:hypothetical protein
MTTTEITPTMIEAAARVLAHREEFNENKWPKYADTTERMLRAAQAAERGEGMWTAHPKASVTR